MNIHALSVKSTLVSALLALVAVTGFAACAAPVDSGDEQGAAATEQVGEAKEAITDCCYGYWICPTTGATVDWASGPRSCATEGELTYSGAHTACNAACSASCTVVQTECFPL